VGDAISYEEAWARTHQFEPPAIFGRLVKERPLARMVYPDGHIGWIAVGYDVVRQVLSRPQFSHRMDIGHFPVTKGGVAPQIVVMPGMFIHMDPPDHTRYRSLLTREFTARRVSQLMPRVAAVVAEQIDVMRDCGAPADLVATFANPLVLRLLSELVGLPASESERYANASAAVHDPDVGMERTVTVLQDFAAFIGEVIDSKRKKPGDDIISRLIATAELTDEELCNVASLLLFAGYETTESSLAVGVFALLCHPEQLSALRADLSKIDGAIEEVLRYITVNQFEIIRTAVEDVELSGEVIRKGETITISLPAANRDPVRFDCPENLDLDRVTAGHVAFGHGIHQCVGQNLARLELRVALRALLQEFPDLRLDVAVNEVPLRTRGSIFHVKSLPVSW
jgi:cytochrome P450